MQKRRVLQMAMLIGGFALIGFVFLLIAWPLMAVLYLMLWMLAGTILWFAYAPLPAAVHEAADAFRQRREEKRKAQMSTQLVDTNFYERYQLVNTHNSQEVYRIDRMEYLIGRSREAAMCLAKNRAVSSRHCRIVYRKYSQEYYIEDLNSTSGTYVGARRLEPYKQEKLLPNVEITLAGLTYCFCPIP